MRSRSIRKHASGISRLSGMKRSASNTSSAICSICASRKRWRLVRCAGCAAGGRVRPGARPPQRAAEQKGVTLTADVAPGAEIVTGDPMRLEQALQNLAANALRHTPRGGRVNLRAAFEDERVVVTVNDTGSGIAAEHLPHVFDRFYKVDPARASEATGSGLGLSIVKAIVERHGASHDGQQPPRGGGHLHSQVSAGSADKALRRVMRDARTDITLASSGARTPFLTYEPYYGLKEKPFSLSSDPRFLYKSRAHAAVYDDLSRGHSPARRADRPHGRHRYRQDDAVPLRSEGSRPEDVQHVRARSVRVARRSAEDAADRLRRHVGRRSEERPAQRRVATRSQLSAYTNF